MATRGWEHVTPRDLTAKTLAKPSKYKNVRVQVDGHTFDSKREAAVYGELRLRERAGQISDLQIQVKFPLYAPILSNKESAHMYLEVAEYIADFVFEERGFAIDMGYGMDRWKRIVVDVKGGKNTAMFNLKKKWLFLQEGIEIREIR